MAETLKIPLVSPNNPPAHIAGWIDQASIGQVPAGTVPVPGDQMVYDPQTGLFAPTSQLTPMANAAARFEAENLVGANGADFGNWRDSAGGADLAPVTTHALVAVDALDGIRAAAFPGVSTALRRGPGAAVNATRLTVFLVARHYFQGATVPWSLGKAAVASNAAGCARGIFGAASVVMGAQANNLSGATAHGAGSTVLDEASSINTAGEYVRRAYCFDWGDVIGGPGGVGLSFWSFTAYVGAHCATTPLAASPVGTNFSFTTLCLGAENNGGGAPTLYAVLDLSYFAYHVDSPATRQQIALELARLRARYKCL